MVRPTREELEAFGEPDYVILNAGRFPACPFTPQVTSETSVCLSFERREFVILGTEYAGEMKKGVFTIMNYLMPKRGILSMHCSANEGDDGDVVSVLWPVGHGQDDALGRPSTQADRRRRTLLDRRRCVQH